MFKLQFKDNPNRSIWLVGEKISVGTNQANDLVLEGLGVSEFHAELHIHPDHLVLNSRAGSCFVNELPVDAHYQLAANDIIRVGKERLQIIDSKHLDAIKPINKKTEGELETGWSLICSHPKLSNRDFHINKNTILGRSKDCTLSVPYKLLSREHASLRVENEQLFLVDLGSANGCFVNGERVDQSKLNPGDTVAFAKLSFIVKGPISEVTFKEEAPDEDEMNKTMMRSVIDMDIALKNSPKPPSRQVTASVEISDKMITKDKPTVVAKKNTRLWLVGLSCLIVIMIAVGAILHTVA